MASNQGNDDVLKLLQQLEELKQKKARNVKKLKRKLGKAVLLRQDSNSGSVSNISEQKNLCSRTINSEVRSVLAELNCKNSSLPVLLSSEKEILQRDIGIKCMNNDTDACINLQSKEAAISQTSQPVPHQNFFELNEKEIISANLDLGVTTSTNHFNEIVPESIPQNEILYKKRSSSELMNHGQYSNHTLSNKKIKTDVSTEMFQNRTSCIDATMPDEGDHLVTDIYSVKMDNPHKMPEHLNNVCQNKDTCTEIDTIGIIQSSQPESKKLELSSDNIKNCQMNPTVSNKKDTNSVSLKHSEKPIQLDISQDKINKIKNTSIEPNEGQLKDIVKDTCILKGMEYTEIVKETETNNAGLVVENIACNFASLNQNKNLQEAEPPELNVEEDLDYTITEVAETVAVFLSKSTQEIIGTDSNSLINISQPEVANYEEVANSPLEVEDTEEIMKNFKQATDEFDEENSNCFRSKHNSDSENTDYEGFDSECDDSADVYRNECEDDILIKNSQDDVSDVEYKIPENDFFCQKENVNMIKDENLHLDSINSDVLVVPETELFDFVRYNTSEMQVDDVAHNISIVTDNNTKCENVSQNVLNCQNAKENVNCNLDVNSAMPNNVEIKHHEELNSSSECQGIMKAKESENFLITSEDQILCNQLCTETEFDTDSPGTEDFLKLVNCQQMLLKSEDLRTDLKEIHTPDYENSSLKFTCSLQCGITETVSNLKLTSFNDNQYLFIQHLTWIQVWRQERNEDWIKIFCHQVDDSFQLQELCASKDDNYLVLVMLLTSEQHDHCLQFIVFERESKLIKLMEHAHQFESSYTKDEKTFLCGLDSMRFTSAIGQETFKVYSHTISCLDGNPRLLTVSLGSTIDCLHSLCRIDKLPNALLGMSHNMLYVWHLIEARLVTSVCLQVENSLIENCFWATVENGLVFLLVSCEVKEEPETCKLLAVNLATGFCQSALSYTLQPALEVKSLNSKMSLAYSEPLISAISKDGAFIWSIHEEYCCASLKETNVSSIELAPILQDSFMIFVGCDKGCVNCYELKFR